ncbi:MAG TPA: hypothetical protein VFY71_03240 [Planctomycetota bacterium]|nr:hypothetical protein [Planctomycetota bacterium]
MNARHFALLLVLAAPAAAVQDKAPAQPGFEHVVPSDSVFFVGVSDVEEFGRNFRASPAGRFWYDPANAPLREALEARIDGLTAQMHAELGVDPLKFLDMLHGRLALTTVGLPRVEDLQAGPPHGFALALLADVGPDHDACETLVSALESRLAEELGAVRKSAVTGDTEISVLELAHGDEHEPSLRLKHGFHGDTLVLTLELHPMQAEALETLIARLDGEPGESLADVPRFAGSLAAETGGTQLWIDCGRILGLVREALVQQGDDDRANFLGRTGLFDLGCLSMNSAYEKAGSRMRLRLDWWGSGWIQSFARLACVSGPPTTLGVVPADCLSAFAARVDFGGLFDAAVKALIDSGAVTMPDVVGFLSEAEESLGFNPRDDLLEALDGQVTLVQCAVPPEDAIPGLQGDPQNMLLLVGLKDGTRVNGIIEDAVRRTGLHAARKRTEFQGYEMFGVPVFPGFEVHYAVLPDLAVLSLSGALLQDVLRRKADPDLPSLAKDKEFQARFASLTRAPGLLEYQDTAANAKAALHMLDSVGELLERIDVGSMGGLGGLLTGLPKVDEALIDRHFKGATVAALSVDENGLMLEAVSP